jgi:hypothetical protein
MPRFFHLVVPAVMALLCGCGQLVDAAGADEVAQRLQGRWVREQTAEGVRSRRILTLAGDGTFTETVRVIDATGASREYLHEGTWIYDGTNLKRKYTLMAGKPPSRLNLPFVTFEIAFRSRNEFEGIDHIHRNRIQYHRVQPETEL